MLTGFFNTLRPATPPLDLPARVELEYGRPQVMWPWLMLDEMWDYRTDDYRFDYTINENPNEPGAANQSPIGGMDNYYQVYRRAYQPVNDALEPDRPLEVGGPSGHHVESAQQLARDDAPDKRLDNLSSHDSWMADEPSAAVDWASELRSTLEDASLSDDLPVFISETGYVEPKDKHVPANNLVQAAGMTTVLYHARHLDAFRVFPWVAYHSESQIAFVQFDPAMRTTPLAPRYSCSRCTATAKSPPNRPAFASLATACSR